MCGYTDQTFTANGVWPKPEKLDYKNYLQLMVKGKTGKLDYRRDLQRMVEGKTGKAERVHL